MSLSQSPCRPCLECPLALAVEQVYTRGVEISTETRQNELLERYTDAAEKY